MRFFQLFLLCSVLSLLRRKEVVQGVILVYLYLSAWVEALWQLWLLSSASSRRKGSNSIKWPQLYFNFEVWYFQICNNFSFLSVNRMCDHAGTILALEFGFFIYSFANRLNNIVVMWKFQALLHIYFSVCWEFMA